MRKIQFLNIAFVNRWLLRSVNNKGLGDNLSNLHLMYLIHNYLNSLLKCKILIIPNKHLYAIIILFLTILLLFLLLHLLAILIDHCIYLNLY